MPARLVALCCAFALLAACQQTPTDPSTPMATATTESPAKEETKVTPPPRPERPAAPPMFAGSHILVAYKGAMRSKAARTKQEAQKLAAELAVKARQDPTKFADLARAHSDGPSGPKGGSLGSWPKGRMVPAFDQAIEKMKVGQISDPVETPFGFHVIMRNDPDAP